MAAERIEELGLDIEEISEKNAQLHDSLAQLVRAVQNIRSRGRSEHQVKGPFRTSGQGRQADFRFSVPDNYYRSGILHRLSLIETSPKDM